MKPQADLILTPGKRMQALCEARGISRKELANRLDIAPSQVSRILNEDTKSISSDILIKMATEFHVSTDYLLERTDDKTDYSKGVPDQAKTDSNEDQTGIKIVDMYLSLDNEDRKKAESFMDYLLSNEKYRVVQHTQAGA